MAEGHPGTKRVYPIMQKEHKQTVNHTRRKLEYLFGRFACFAFDHKWAILLFFFLIISALSYCVRFITLDTSDEALFHKNDPVRVAYENFRQEFGQDRFILITISGKDIFSRGFLNRLKDLHKRLENEVPNVLEVQSLVNARRTISKNNELVVDTLLDNNKEEIPENLKNEVMNTPFYINNFISEDGKVAAILVKPRVFAQTDEGDILAGFESGIDALHEKTDGPRQLSVEENAQVVYGVNKIMEEAGSEGFEIYATGTPVFKELFDRIVITDMVKFTVLSIGVIILVLGLLFRKVSGVLYPMVIVLSSLSCTLGVMGILGVPIKMTFLIIPSFLMCVGVADSVHILAIFYRNFTPGRSKREAMATALEHSGIPVMLTSLTTAAGLLSFGLAELAAVASMGIFASIGVMFAFIFTLFLLPACIAIHPMKPAFANNNSQMGTVIHGLSRTDRMLTWFSGFSTKRAGAIILVFLITCPVFGYLILQLRFSHDPLSWFPDSLNIAADAYHIDKQMKGSVTLEAVVDTGKKNGLYNPELLKALDAFSKEMEDYRMEGLFAGKTFSISDIVKEINKAMYENDPAYYRIPDERTAVAQELLLFESTGSDDLEEIADSGYQKARVTIKTPWKDAIIYDRFIREVKNRLQERVKGMAEVKITGMVALLSRMIPATIYSMVKSYTMAVIVISIMMMILVRSISLGLVTMIPNLYPICVVLAMMGFFDIPLDMNTILIGSVILGLIVDDTVHFVYNYLKYYSHEESGIRNGTERGYFATKNTLLTAGRAMMITSVVLASGFFVLIFATLENFIQFGFLSGLSILVALGTDFILAPALFTKIMPYSGKFSGIFSARRIQTVS